MLNISVYASLFETKATQRSVTWQELAADLQPSFQWSEKKTMPLWSPANVDGDRQDVNVIDVACLVLDVDGQPDTKPVEPMSEDEAADFISSVPYGNIVYTTWSHEPDAYRFRMVVRLSRPIQPGEWKDFWFAAVEHLNAPVSTKECTGLSHAYYPAGGPPGTEDIHFTVVNDGPPLDVDGLLAGSPGPGATEPPKPKKENRKLSRDIFERFAKATSRRKNEAWADLGNRLLSVVAGEVFAEPGERDITVFRLSSLLGERFIEYSPESIAAHFAISLDRMSVEDDPISVQDVVYKIRRAQDAVLAEKQKKQQNELTARARRIQEAFKNGRTDPYRPEEYAPEQRWVIQSKNSFYFWLDGGYVGPYTSHEARAAAVRDLMPAHAAIELFTVDAKGNVVPKALEKIVMEYGTVAHQVIVDLKAQKASYDEKTRAITEAPCPVRRLEPTYDPKVAKWLELLGGDRHDDLLMWIAALTHLDRPCAALFLTGPKGAGKSVFAEGHARIWTKERPTYLDEALGAFNESLARCPLVLADETLPRDFRGFAKNAELRHHIQAVSRPLSRKHIPNSTLLGATRTIVAANNEEVLATPENLSADDVGAIAARYFHRAVGEDSAYYLAEINPRKLRWVDNDVIAKHALWLRDNHKWESHERFIIPPTDELLHRSLTVRSGIRSALCQWLVGFLNNPTPFRTNPRAKPFVRIKGKKIYANVQGISRCWATYVPDERCPPAGKLSSALASLSTGERYQQRVDNRKVNYRVVNIDNLVAWAEMSDYGDRSTLAQHIEELEERDDDANG